jgi:hypothetical protein
MLGGIGALASDVIVSILATEEAKSSMGVKFSAMTSG